MNEDTPSMWMRIHRCILPALALAMFVNMIARGAIDLFLLMLNQIGARPLGWLIYCSRHCRNLLSLAIALTGFWLLHRAFRKNPVPIVLSYILLLVALFFQIEVRMVSEMTDGSIGLDEDGIRADSQVSLEIRCYVGNGSQDEPLLENVHVEDAYVLANQMSSFNVVLLLTEDGAEGYRDVYEDNKGQDLSFVLNGVCIGRVLLPELGSNRVLVIPGTYSLVEANRIAIGILRPNYGL